MPAISKIRFTNVIYEDGNKRYNDDTFYFDGHNSAILLENGGGKTVFIQTAIQAILPHSSLADRKIKDTLQFDGQSAHIAIEWILNDKPRRYAVTAVTLFMTNQSVDSLRYTCDYEEGDKDSIEHLPFVRTGSDGKKRAATRQDMQEYYSYKAQQNMNAQTFSTIKEYHKHIEEQYKIIPTEWQKIVTINGAEGDVEAFFENCQTTGKLFDQLLIPTVEEALAGNGSTDFAEMFEQQREHFKKYKQLREQIEESKLVEEQINSLVDVYKRLAEKETLFGQSKEKTKAYAHFILAEKRKVETALIEVEADLEKWNAAKKQLEIKFASYTIAVEESEFNKLGEELKTVQKEAEEAKDRLNQTLFRLHSLQAAHFKKIIEDQTQIKEQKIRELARLNEDIDIQTLREEMDQNSSELRGYFLAEEERLEKEWNVVFQQLKRVQETFDESKMKLDEADSNFNTLSNEKSALEATADLYKNDMTELAAQILDRKETEHVEEEYPKWIKQAYELDEQIVDYKNLQVKLEKQSAEMKKELKPLREKQSHDSSIFSNVKVKLSQYQSEHDQLLTLLHQEKPEWSYYTSLYDRQSTINNQLNEKLGLMSARKEELLREERIGKRFDDDYAEREYFTADPYIDEMVKKWKNQFDMVQSGTEFLQGIAEEFSLDVDKKWSPIWPMSIIVSERDFDKAVEKVEKLSDKWTQPVYVLSIMDARKLIEEELTSHAVITPDFWKMNVSYDGFKQWKHGLKLHAMDREQERKNHEAEVEKWKSLRDQVERFYQTYPLEDYQQLKRELSEYDQLIKDQSKKIEEIEKEIEANGEKIKIYSKKEKEASGLFGSLQSRIEIGRTYLKKKQELEKTSKVLAETSLKLAEVGKVRSELRKELSRKNEQVEDAKVAGREVKSAKDGLRDKEFYLEVKKYQPVYTSKGYEALKSGRSSIHNQLAQHQQGRSVIEQTIKYADERIAGNSLQFNQLKNEAKDLDENLVFPVNGQVEMERLHHKKRKMESEFEAASHEFRKVNEKYVKQEATLNVRLADFQKNFPSVDRFLFQTSLLETERQLEEEEQKLKRELIWFNELRKKHENLLRELNDSHIFLEKKNEAFHFLAEGIEPSVINEEEAQKLTYERLTFINKIVAELSFLQGEVNEAGSRVREGRARFTQFCNSKVQDAKTKEKALTGLEQKDRYSEIVQWAELMNKRIQHAIRLAEDDMQGHDQQVQQFISHLHSYLQTISAELQMIPKKTRVKVEDSYKEIFSFKIPEWNEQEGKLELRKHIDWMINQLDSGLYQTDDGLEDTGKMKKDIQKWLHPKQLLHMVMKGNEMKVSCRKVSNDGKVSNSPKSWERSNKWSGGEKWSKNMTLFLGILNYLAEKRQHIQSGSKRHRTVIVDNPFGKASSDHVLNPVFFIAEQLGFQIIALTAHAEGKFLRDYFPIIYSCRLRSSADGNTSIMTKAKDIRQAYFQDHDPLSLARLGEVEQLALF